MLGFRVDIVRFPDRATSIILLGNDAYSNPTGDALTIGAKLLDLPQDVPTETKPTGSIKTDFKTGQALSGKYFFDDWNNWKAISFRNDTLFIDGNQPLWRQSDGSYIGNVFGSPNELYFSQNTLTIKNKYRVRRGVRFDDTPPTSREQ